MTIVERVQDTLESRGQELLYDEDFQKLSEFYIQMQKAGIARKQAYSLPPTDTIGRRLHEVTSNLSRR